MKTLFTTCIVALAAISSIFSIPIPESRTLEVMIPMRDGTELHTLINFPRDDGVNKWTAIVDRSPYGYGDMEWIPDIFIPFGFVSVGQDMRGTEKSQGNFSMWQSDANDGQDLGDWIVSQDWSNGKIMTFGASADGIGSIQTPKNQPGWLAGQYVAWAPSEMYKILFPYGTYKKETTENWLFGVTMPNPDVVYDNIQTVYANEAHNDFWRGIELDEADFQKITFPSAFWGGWYDLFVVGTLSAYEGYNQQSAESVRYTSRLTVDPLGHCLGGAEYFTQNAVFGRTAVAISQIFEVYGIHPVSRSAIKNVTFYVMSSNDEAGLSAGQYWTSLESWPVPKMTDYYLHADGTASRTPPKTADSSSTSYIFDPSNPAPTSGGNNLPPDIGGSIECGPLDQAAIDARVDVLTFQTDVQTTELALTGSIWANLFVSSSAVDTDFMVKVSDVYPTGEVRILQDNALRMRWRDGFEQAVMMKKNTVYEIGFDLWNTSYIVAPGHALRFSITSSNNPRFSVNPNNGLLLADPLFPGENITATNTLFHSERYKSKIVLPVVTRRQLPEVHVIKEVQTAYPQLTDEVIAKYTNTFNNMLTRKNHKK